MHHNIHVNEPPNINSPIIIKKVDSGKAFHYSFLEQRLFVPEQSVVGGFDGDGGENENMHDDYQFNDRMS